jgi:hypothetical protein
VFYTDANKTQDHTEGAHWDTLMIPVEDDCDEDGEVFMHEILVCHAEVETHKRAVPAFPNTSV